MNTNFHTESRMREICTYGSMRGIRRKTAKHVLRVAEGRAGVPDEGRPALLYSPLPTRGLSPLPNLPSSVIGGAVGLLVFSTCGHLLPPDLRASMAKCPGFLINVIFATIFLGAAVPKLGDIVRFALPQLTVGQLIAWGQYVVGLGLAGFLFARFFGVPPAFGNLLEIGFEAGTARSEA